MKYDGWTMIICAIVFCLFLPLILKEMYISNSLQNTRQVKDAISYASRQASVKLVTHIDNNMQNEVANEHRQQEKERVSADDNFSSVVHEEDIEKHDSPDSSNQPLKRDVIREVDRSKIRINLQEAEYSFFNTFFENFGSAIDNAYREELKSRIPVMLALGFDGYYINHWETKENGQGYNRVWTEKKPYAMVIKPDDTRTFVCYMNLDNVLRYEERVGSNVVSSVEGDFDTVNKALPKSMQFKDLNHYMKFKKQKIAQLINSDLTYYVNEANIVATRNGIRYLFKPPRVVENQIEDIGYLAFFQGKPKFLGMTINVSGYGKAEIVNKHMIETFILDGVKYYHMDGDTHDIGNIKVGKSFKKAIPSVKFRTREEACQAGYRPSPFCEY